MFKKGVFVATNEDINKKSLTVKIRFSPIEYSQVKAMAEIYSNGDMSKWIRHLCKNYYPQMINKKGPRKRPLKKKTLIRH